MLTGKQKRYLRGLAVNERSVFQIGKEGLSYNLFNTVDDYLTVHELVKISILKNCDLEVREAAIDVASNVGAEVVQIIGRVIVLYRPSKERKIVLPRD